MLIGMQRLPSVAALAAVLRVRKRAEEKRAYGLQLVWQLNVQLCAMNGGSYTVPDYFTMFPQDSAVHDRRDAATIRQTVLSLLGQRGGGEATL